jgi:hypothetical protein
MPGRLNVRYDTALTKATTGDDMRKIEFKIEVKTGYMVTLVEGKKIPNINFDRNVVKDAVKHNRVSPYMRDNLLKNLKRMFEDSGFSLQPDELRFIMKRYEGEFNP